MTNTNTDTNIETTFFSQILGEKGLPVYYYRMGVYFGAEKIMEMIVDKYGNMYPQIIKNPIGKRLIHFIIYDAMKEIAAFLLTDKSEINMIDYIKEQFTKRLTLYYLQELVFNMANDYLVDGLVDNYKDQLPDFIKKNDNLIIVLKFVIFDAIKDLYAYFVGQSPIQPINYQEPIEKKEETEEPQFEGLDTSVLGI